MNKFLIGKAKTGKKFSISAEFVTQVSAVLGRRGSGKTYTAAVMAEGLLSCARQVVIVDPLDAWWGLRSSADGKGEGYPIVIFGGEHADIPLDETSGSRIAEIVVENPGLSIILSLHHLRKNAQRRFMTDFAEYLFRLKGRPGRATPVHLFVDEADCYCPQRAWKGMERLLGAMEDLVRRGRRFGIGVTPITQRPAVLNKNVLVQAELLITGQITGPQDKKAIKAWIEDNASIEKQGAFIASLAQLKIGEMWFWSPGWLGCLEKLKVRKRTTFDSSATPKAGQRVVEPRKMTLVELDKIRKSLEEVLDKAKMSDPVALRRRVLELEKELRQKKPTAAPKPVQAPIDKRAITKMIHKAVAERDEEWSKKVTAFVSSMNARLSEFLGKQHKALCLTLGRFSKQLPKIDMPLAKPTPLPDTRVVASERVAQVARVPSGSVDTNLGRCQRALLTVLAQKGTPCTKRLIALQSGYSIKSSGFANALSALRTREYIENTGGLLRITDEGNEALGEYVLLPSGEELIGYWKAKLGKCQRMILEVVAGAYPNTVTKPEIAASTGYSLMSSGFANALSALRGLELIQGRDDIMLRDEVFS